MQYHFAVIAGVVQYITKKPSDDSKEHIDLDAKHGITDDPFTSVSVNFQFLLAKLQTVSLRK